MNSACQNAERDVQHEQRVSDVTNMCNDFQIGALSSPAKSRGSFAAMRTNDQGEKPNGWEWDARNRRVRDCHCTCWFTSLTRCSCCTSRSAFLQAEVHWVYVLSVGFGLLVVLGLHVTAAIKEAHSDRSRDESPATDGFADVCA